MRDLQIAIIGDAQADTEKYEFCERLGSFLGKKGYTLITGGRSGVMEAVCKGAYHTDAITVGILPTADLDDANRFCKVVIPTDMGHARNSLTALSGDVIIAIGGRAGTLTELGFAWIHHKPIIAVTSFGGWAKALANNKIDDRREDNIIAVKTLDELEIEIEKMVKKLKKT
jgi:uncharacterized protein (TIGR00725 family)